MPWSIGSPAFALGWRLALVVLAAAALWQVMTMPPMEATGTPPPAPPLAAPEPEPSDGDAGGPAGGYPAIAAHPLFYPSRMPWVPPPPPPEPEPEPVIPTPPALDGYSVVGVIVSGTTRAALVRASGENSTVLLNEGQEFEGWTLMDVTQEKLVFSAGDARYEMIFPRHSTLGQ